MKYPSLKKIYTEMELKDYVSIQSKVARDIASRLKISPSKLLMNTNFTTIFPLFVDRSKPISNINISDIENKVIRRIYTIEEGKIDNLRRVMKRKHEEGELSINDLKSISARFEIPIFIVKTIYRNISK